MMQTFTPTGSKPGEGLMIGDPQPGGDVITPSTGVDFSSGVPVFTGFVDPVPDPSLDPLTTEAAPGHISEVTKTSLISGTPGLAWEFSQVLTLIAFTIGGLWLLKKVK